MSLALYQDFPSTWPEYTPRDKLADWLEQYPTTHDLVVWTNSELSAHPRYDEDDKQWDVTVTRDGVDVKLRPSHIVMATGLLGSLFVPHFADIQRFRGAHMHSSEFPGGAHFAGKRAVVVGAANSSIDICQDLVLKGALSVTMIQRSETLVITRDHFNEGLKQIFPEDEPMDVSDLKFASLPLSLQEKLSVARRQETIAIHKDVYENLRKGGVALTDAGTNPYGLYYSRSGGASMQSLPRANAHDSSHVSQASVRTPPPLRREDYTDGSKLKDWTKGVPNS